MLLRESTIPYSSDLIRVESHNRRLIKNNYLFTNVNVFKGKERTAQSDKDPC